MVMLSFTQTDKLLSFFLSVPFDYTSIFWARVNTICSHLETCYTESMSFIFYWFLKSIWSIWWRALFIEFILLSELNHIIVTYYVRSCSATPYSYPSTPFDYYCPSITKKSSYNFDFFGNTFLSVYNPILCLAYSGV